MGSNCIFNHVILYFLKTHLKSCSVNTFKKGLSGTIQDVPQIEALRTPLHVEFSKLFEGSDPRRELCQAYELTLDGTLLNILSLVTTNSNWIHQVTSHCPEDTKVGAM